MAGIADALMAPFQWSGNEAVTKAELDRRKKIADSLRAPAGYQPTGPWSTIGSLAKEGVAAYKDNQTSQAESAAQQAVADALAKGDYQAVLSNDLATPQQSAVASALWQQKQQDEDPLRKLQIEQAQLNLEQDKNPPKAPPEPPKVETVYDPATGGEKKVQWNASTGMWEDLGGVAAPKEPLVNVNTGPNETQFQKENAINAAKYFDTVSQDGAKANSMLGDLSALKDIGANLNTGKGAEITGALGPYAQALGFDIKGLDEIQAYNAIVARIAPTMRVAGSGATSDFEMQKFLEALPSIGKTAEGNAIISQTLQAIAEQKQAAAAIADAAIAGEISQAEARKRIRELPDPLAMWKEANKRGSITDTGSAQDGFTVIDGVKIRPKNG